MDNDRKRRAIYQNDRTEDSLIKKINSFFDNLKDGKKWEEHFCDLLKKYVRKLLVNINYKLMDYEKYPNAQKSGVDLRPDFSKDELTLFKKIVDKEIDVKTRDYTAYAEYGDILIEIQRWDKTRTVATKRGWFYYSKSDIIAYLWKSEDESTLIDGYAINIHDEELREWFEENKTSLRSVWSPSNTKPNELIKWWTENKAVDIDKFPPKSLVQIPKTFFESLNGSANHIDPRQLIQSKLSQFFERMRGIA